MSINADTSAYVPNFDRSEFLNAFYECGIPFVVTTLLALFILYQCNFTPRLLAR
jgi:hypothetical protein